MNEPSALNQRERELQSARQRGRWLSDEEQAAVDAEQQLERTDEQARRQNRHKLIILTAVCILLPPLWPLALALTLVLLYPAAMARIGKIAGALFLLVGLLAAGLLGLFTFWLIHLLM